MLLTIVNLVTAYAKYPEEHCVRQQEIHSCSECIHKWEVTDCEASILPTKPDYSEVDHVLKDMQEYKVLELDTKYLPESRQQ